MSVTLQRCRVPLAGPNGLLAPRREAEHYVEACRQLADS